jgi:2-dehydropantoate 2-reductase
VSGPPSGPPGPAGRPVLVVGAGAVGSFLAGVLAHAGHPVSVVDRRAWPLSADDRVTIADGGGRRYETAIRRVRDPGEVTGAPWAIVFAVKMFDLPGAIDGCHAWPAAPALTIQNGVGAEEIALERRPGTGLVAGSLTTPLERAPDGEVHWRSRGGIGLAPVTGEVDPLIAELASAMAAIGLPARRVADPRAMKWSKLLLNLVGNATSALVDADPAEVYGDPRLFSIERRQLLEAIEVMDALGAARVALPGADARLLAMAVRLPEPVSRAALRRVVGGARGGKMPSLRLHLRDGAGPSEVGWLNGAVAREGERLGVATPVNRRLAELVDAAAMDHGLRDRLAGHPERVADAIISSTAAEPAA